eukprot:3925577-Amphidinium_carterae.1
MTKKVSRRCVLKRAHLLQLRLRSLGHFIHAHVQQCFKTLHPLDMAVDNLKCQSQRCELSLLHIQSGSLGTGKVSVYLLHANYKDMCLRT